MTPPPSTSGEFRASGTGELASSESDLQRSPNQVARTSDHNQDGQSAIPVTVGTPDVHQISVCTFDELAAEDLERWEQIRSLTDDFTPPFFAARFAAAVHAVRNDVLIAVLRAKDNTPLGFFPFHRIGGVGVPAGRFLNDAQNVIAAPGLIVDWTELARAAKVRAFNLHAIAGCDPTWTQRYNLQSVKAFRALQQTLHHRSNVRRQSRGHLRRPQQVHPSRQRNERNSLEIPNR
ncbi:MAG: hypothetical protein ACF8AM_11490 [Rhodopirellula sp. JB055]|uniref:hypothetical protein n=1 Tax=Rhodopirellula sp. JB055 TaxID=3342846 RepID=UPI00370BC683